MTSTGAGQSASKLRGRSRIRGLFQPHVHDKHQHLKSRERCEKRRRSGGEYFNPGCETIIGVRRRMNKLKGWRGTSAYPTTALTTGA